MSNLIDRQAAIDALDGEIEITGRTNAEAVKGYVRLVRDRLERLPSAQPDSFVDADKLKRCRFEYINACKIVARPTPDTSKSDIYDAHALIKALHPIFGDVEF